MAVLNWGDLTKSQEDDETIEEAIARIVGEHEENAESHLGAGESLAAHKAADIIDHPQGSVLGDKFTNKEFALSFPFESLDEYNKSGTGIYNDVAGYRLDTGAVSDTERYLEALAQYSNIYFNVDRDTTFQFFTRIAGTSDYLAYVLAGGNNPHEGPPGIGFKFEDGNLYACEHVWGSEDFEEYTQQITGIDPGDWHVYRVQFVADDNTAYFYVDGVFKCSLVLHSNDDIGLVMFSSYIINTAASNKQLYVNSIYLSINPIT